jgi:hypothetical protein
MTIPEVIALIAALTAAITSLANAYVSVRTSAKVDSTHLLVNGTATQINALSKSVGHAEGLAEGLASPLSIGPASTSR